MYIGLVIFVIIAIFLFFLFKNISQNDDKNEDIIKKDAEEKIEVEEIFYKEVRNGEKTYKFMNVFNQFDLMLVKSMFQSEQIPYYIESEHISKIRSGMQIGSFGNANVYILDKDYDDAIKIIEEYKENKIVNYKEKQTIKKPLEVLVGALAVPETSDINGIVIKYKKNI